MNADFFHVSAGIPPPLASLGEALSMREKVNAVDVDAGRLDACRVDGAAAATADGSLFSVSWYCAGMAERPCPSCACALKKRSCLISADAGGEEYCTLTSTLRFFFASGLGVRLMRDDDVSL